MGEIRFVGTGETRGYPYPEKDVLDENWFTLRESNSLLLILPSFSKW